MRTEAVRPYYDSLKSKPFSRAAKKIFDICCALFMLVLLSPLFLILALLIKIDSEGPVFFRQTRITRYGKEFWIFKFRTMVANAEKIGSQITGDNDARITKLGAKIRDYRLDEIPQLLNVLTGDMTFVGARPEVPRYVAAYTDEMYATLLMPAGITCEACLKYKDETEILAGTEEVDKAYVEKVLPGKMAINLRSLKDFNFFTDLAVMIKTVLAVMW